MQDSADKFRYGSSEFQFIAFDELTEFPEEDYLFLFSRLRRTTGMEVPLRMRSASNPGNVGHGWVKERFIVGRALLPVALQSAGKDGQECPSYNSRAYIPARIADNPAVDEAEYRRTLAHLPLVERERLMNGDWNIRAEGLIRPHWLRRYEMQGQLMRLQNERWGLPHCLRFLQFQWR